LEPHFFSTQGIFVTAKHVLDDVIDKNNKQTNPIAAFQILPNKQYIIRGVTKAVFHNKADIALGILAQAKHNKTGKLLQNKVVKLNSNSPGTKSDIFTYAYPKTKCDIGKVWLTADYYEGQIISHYPKGGGCALLGNSYHLETNMKIENGASGGSVFDINGKIIGINSAELENQTNTISFITHISELLSLKLECIIPNTNPQSAFYSVSRLADLGYIILENG